MGELAQALTGQEEIVMWTRRSDGSWTHRTIWVVTVDGEAYARTGYVDGSAWYRHIRAGHEAEVQYGRHRVPVTVTPVADRALWHRVSDAYRAKYGRRYAGSVAATVAPQAEESTVHLTSR
jgi:hypothetical protein